MQGLHSSYVCVYSLLFQSVLCVTGCCVPWHSGVECEEFQRLNDDERGREDMMVVEFAKDNKWSRSPHCKFYVERTEGCPQHILLAVPAVDYQFDPTDKELIAYYPFNKGLFEALEEDTLYFFTRLKKKAEKGKIIDRVTDSGTWKGQQGDKEIFCYNGNQMVHIGSKSNFSFIPKEGVKESRGMWVMHEYLLKGCQLDQNNNSYWLCRIKKMNKKGKKGWAALDYNDDDDDNGLRTTHYGPSDHDVGVATTERNVFL
ncbi:hypothetical protein Q3G72_016014 [Acer saccharum]|nr:hypothetical protein Q3G72_016014 [Acer saccharum]